MHWLLAKSVSAQFRVLSAIVVVGLSVQFSKVLVVIMLQWLSQPEHGLRGSRLEP